MFRFALVVALTVGVALSTPTVEKIESSLFASNQVENVMVRFAEGNSKVLSLIESQSQKFATRGHKITSLKHALESNAQTSQQKVQSFLNGKAVQFKSFWISNEIFIEGATRDLIEALAAFPEVSEINKERIAEYGTPVVASAQKPNNPAMVEWGIERIQAQEAWRITNGTGVVVSTIDSGVQHTHEAIRDSWRSDRGWFDGQSGDEIPSDGNSHGTHTMGTIVGINGIGVAPGAQWIHCRCGTTGCPQSAATACGQWIMCPTQWDGSDPDCSKAPSVVSNSWGSSGGDYWFEATTEAWVTAGIVPFFSNGNSGTSCGRVGSPGDYRRVIGVGSTNVNNQISDYSSAGPAVDGRIKPEISAPGEDVRSSVPGSSDNSYGVKSGTSMASPHACGVAALLLSVNPNMTFGQVRQALLDGVDHNVQGRGLSCNGLDDTKFPNHHFGFGVINALKVVENAQKSLSK